MPSSRLLVVAAFVGVIDGAIDMQETQLSTLVMLANCSSLQEFKLRVRESCARQCLPVPNGTRLADIYEIVQLTRRQTVGV